MGLAALAAAGIVAVTSGGEALAYRDHDAVGEGRSAELTLWIKPGDRPETSGGSAGIWRDVQALATALREASAAVAPPPATEAAPAAPAPAPAPAPEPPAPAATDWQSMVYGYPWPAEEALQVIWHESGGNPWAVNPSSGACGLWQHYPCVGMDLYLQFDLAYQKWAGCGGSFQCDWYAWW
jgi:hypothetical protein